MWAEGAGSAVAREKKTRNLKKAVLGYGERDEVFDRSVRRIRCVVPDGKAERRC